MRLNWTQDDTNELLTLKDTVECDEIRVKEKIKEALLKNRFLIHVLDNKELEPLVEDDGTGVDEYFGVNILPYYMVNPVQHSANTFICYEVQYSGTDRSDRTGTEYKELNIIFYIISNYKDLINVETGIPKHDLLSAIIQDQFNFSNMFGKTIRLISNTPSATDRDFVIRTLVFRQTVDNNLVKVINGAPQLANKIKGAHFVNG